MSDSAIHALAGAAGGIVSMAITYPLTSISTRAQVERSRGKESLLEAVKKAIAQDGVLSLFDGLSSSLMAIAITNAVYFGAFEQTRFAIADIKRKRGHVATSLSTLESILASTIAGAATSIAVNPFWVINTRQTVRRSLNGAANDVEANNGGSTVLPPRKLGFIETAMQIYRAEGLAGFFRGLGPALALVLNPVLQFTLFEQLKNMLVSRRTLALLPAASSTQHNLASEKPVALPLSDFDYFWLGAVSKLFATGTTYPYLTVKSRMQAAREGGKGYTSAWNGVRRIIDEEGGVSALYRGAPAKLLQSMLTAALLFVSKERFYQLAKLLVARAQAAKTKVAA